VLLVGEPPAAVRDRRVPRRRHVQRGDVQQRPPYGSGAPRRRTQTAGELARAAVPVRILGVAVAGVLRGGRRGAEPARRPRAGCGDRRTSRGCARPAPARLRAAPLRGALRRQLRPTVRVAEEAPGQLGDAADRGSRVHRRRRQRELGPDRDGLLPAPVVRGPGSDPRDRRGPVAADRTVWPRSGHRRGGRPVRRPRRHRVHRCAAVGDGGVREPRRGTDDDDRVRCVADGDQSLPLGAEGAGVGAAGSCSPSRCVWRSRSWPVRRWSART